MSKLSPGWMSAGDAAVHTRVALTDGRVRKINSPTVNCTTLTVIIIIGDRARDSYIIINLASHE